MPWCPAKGDTVDYLNSQTRAWEIVEVSHVDTNVGVGEHPDVTVRLKNGIERQTTLEHLRRQQGGKGRKVEDRAVGGSDSAPCNEGERATQTPPTAAGAPQAGLHVAVDGRTHSLGDIHGLTPPQIQNRICEAAAAVGGPRSWRVGGGPSCCAILTAPLATGSEVISQIIRDDPYEVDPEASQEMIDAKRG